MRITLSIVLVMISFTSVAEEIRCGWLDNPTPANVWLVDKEGQWVISTQGLENSLSDQSMDLVYQAFKNERQYVRTNGNHGFSCACLTLETDKSDHSVTHVSESKQLDLKRCLEDTAITKDIPLPFK
jgi:hypothetical protein